MINVKLFDTFPKPILNHIGELYWFINDRKLLQHHVSLTKIDVSNLILACDRKDRQKAHLGFNRWLVSQGAKDGETVILLLGGKF